MHTTIKTPQVLAYLEQNKLTVQDLDVEVTYFLHEFLVKESLNMIFASAGQGKSFLVLAIAIKLLKENMISNCIYLDMDNSTMALKTRSLDTLINVHQGLTYFHHSKLTVPAPNLLVDFANEANVETKSLEGYLVVIDSIRDFLGGRDMNSDRDIIPIMGNLKRLREAGATIIFLHHSTKESGGDLYKGSTSFLDSVDVAYSLKSEKTDNISLKYTLNVYKDRIPVKDTAFRLNTKTLELLQDDFDMQVLDDHVQKFIAKILEVLEAELNGINQTNLLQAVGKTNDDKTARKCLQKYTNKYWKSTKIPSQSNSINYFPIPKIA